MTDVVAIPTARTVTTALTPERLRRRYAAERRFRAYGLIAILTAGAMLFLLLGSILYQGHSAFLQNYIALDIVFDPAEIDPDGARDPDALRGANYTALVRDALKQAFPAVEGRQARRKLYGLVSNDAGLELRDMVLTDPGIIGQTQRIWFKLNDDADIFVKGQVTDITERASVGIGSPTGTGGQIQVLSTSNDFTPILREIKQMLAEMGNEAEDAATRAGRSLAATQRRLEAVTERLADARGGVDSAQVARLEAELSDLESTAASLQNDIAQETARAAELRGRASSAGGSERLSPELPSYLVRINGGLVRATEVANSGVTGEVVLSLESTDDAPAGAWHVVSYRTPESARRLTDSEVSWLASLRRQGDIETRFNTTLFTAGDSRQPEQAGIWGAVVGSFFTLVTVLAISFPLAVLSAVYLEEFAPKNRWTDLIEVNINNLAAVPSIVFGLLGLAVFLNFFGLPRSAPLVGGMVLALMTLPTIIIAARAALKAVPPSIREAALGVGASKLQVMTHHVLPLAMPGILTGTIIGMAQALGETAPLLMIGMVAFIVDIPSGFTDPATVLPVQIYIWADSPERAFVAKTSAAILVLLAFLILMNALAVLLRKRFERRW